MNIFITGGAGFLGSHLANHLHAQGHYVRVLDDLSSGDPDRLHQAINFTRGDVRDVPKLWSLLHGIDVVYHLAALVSVPASVLYPREYNDVNVSGTVSLLEACRDVGMGRVVLASSATVYGDQAEQPLRETMALRPAVPYAVSKLAAENYLFNIAELSGFEAVALRIFNAYGPGQPLPPTHAPVIPKFMQQILGKGSVVLDGDGSQTRDFVYVDDVTAALAAAGSASRVDQQVINVGSGVEISINSLVAQMGRAAGRTPSVLYNEERAGGVARAVGDITKARQLLSYRPRTGLADGLRLLLRHDARFGQSRLSQSAAAGELDPVRP